MKISSKLNGLFAPLQKFLFKKQSGSSFDGAKIVGDLKQKLGFYEELSNFDEVEKRNILEELLSVQSQLERAHVIFNFQTNIDLIESSIYYIESLESKYNYLIKRARELQIRRALKPV